MAENGMGYTDAEVVVNAFYLGTPLPKGHGRMIDADQLRDRMYHETFDLDTELQRWDAGCWIRYKLFEQVEKTTPTIIEADNAESEAEG